MIVHPYRGTRATSNPGKLVDAAGRPAAGFSIWLLSREGLRGGARTNEDGTFTASTLTSGVYQVFILPADDRSDSLHDADFLDAHGSDFPTVMVAEGANPPLLLRMPAK